MLTNEINRDKIFRDKIFREHWQLTSIPLMTHKVVVDSLFEVKEEGDSALLDLYIVSGTFPLWQINPLVKEISGSVSVKIAGSASLEGLQLSFIEDENHYVGNAMYRWVESITEDGILYSFPEEYQKTMVVTLPSVSLTYEGVFPINVGNVVKTADAQFLIRDITFSTNNVKIIDIQS